MKKIGGSIYIHRSSVDVLNQEQFDLVWDRWMQLAKSDFPCNSYDVIKINTKKKTVTFIESPNWDSAREPIVGNAYRVSADGVVKLIKKKSNPQIYHHKWMFVSDDYEGFDVKESKKWSKKWQSIIPKGHSSKIGYKKYWDELLNEFGLEVE